MAGLTDEPCPRCRLETVAGWSASGFMVRVDVQPLTPELELLALLAGRHTYTLHTWARELRHRPPRVIRQRPAGTTPRQTVHMDHQCTPPPLERRA